MFSGSHHVDELGVLVESALYIKDLTIFLAPFDKDVLGVKYRWGITHASPLGLRMMKMLHSYLFMVVKTWCNLWAIDGWKQCHKYWRAHSHNVFATKWERPLMSWWWWINGGGLREWDTVCKIWCQWYFIMHTFSCAWQNTWSETLRSLKKLQARKDFLWVMGIDFWDA